MCQAQCVKHGQSARARQITRRMQKARISADIYVGVLGGFKKRGGEDHQRQVTRVECECDQHSEAKPARCLLRRRRRVRAPVRALLNPGPAVQRHTSAVTRTVHVRVVPAAAT